MTAAAARTGPDALVARRLTAQLLAGPRAKGPVDVARRLLAVQAQDPRGARLALRARSRCVAAGDVDRALTEERSLVITWLNRGTLHLVRSEDYPWLHALTTPPLFTGCERRLRQEGVTPAAADRGVGVVERALADEGPLTRAQLRDRIAAAGVRTEGQALVHLLMLACLRGIAVRGPMQGVQHAYVLVRDWLGEPARAAADRDTALAELARRYLAGHGAASDRDLARWAGLALRDARAGLQAIAGELCTGSDGLVDLARRPRAAKELRPPALLGSYEPVLLGHASRAWVLDPYRERAAVSGGLFRPIALVDGAAAATWRIERGAVEISPFGRLGAAQARELDAEAANVVRFLGSR